MIVDNIELVALFVVLFLGIPIASISYKNGLFKSFRFIKLVNTINKSLKHQGIIGLLLILLSWIWSWIDLKYDGLIVGTTYTYLVIGFFIYLPALLLLNFIKFILIKNLKEK